MHDCETFALVAKLDELRGANTCCLRVNHPGEVCLCISVKRQLFLVTYADRQFTIVRVRSLAAVRW